MLGGAEETAGVTLMTTAARVRPTLMASARDADADLEQERLRALVVGSMLGETELPEKPKLLETSGLTTTQ